MIGTQAERYKMRLAWFKIFDIWRDLNMINLGCSTHGQHVTLDPTFKIFSLPFDVNWWSTITTADGTHWSSVFRRFQVQISCFQHPWFFFHITMCIYLDDFPTLLPILSKKRVCREQLFFKMNLANTMLQSQLSNHLLSDMFLYLNLIIHLFLIANNIRCLIDKSWLLPCEFRFFSCPLKFAALDSPDISFVVLELKRLGAPVLNDVLKIYS